MTNIVQYVVQFLGKELMSFFFQAAIIRSHKDTAHTKAERNILEAVKVCFCSICNRTPNLNNNWLENINFPLMTAILCLETYVQG